MARLDSVPQFDELAGECDQLVPMFSTFAVSLMGTLSLPSGATLLEVGCGRGPVTRAAVARGCVMVAVDASPNMITELRRDQPAVDARVMDAHALDFVAGTFNAAAASFVIHCVDEPERVVAEACRVVRRGELWP